MGRPSGTSRRSLSREVIADAALRLIDREGLSALTMRRVGAELGVEAMAIYHHVPDKAALVEAVMSRGTPGSLPLATGNWRDDLRALMNALYERISAHPALLPLRWERRKAAPEARAALDRENAIFKTAGMGDALAQDAHRVLGGYVIGFVVIGSEASRSISHEEWVTQFNAGLDILMDGIETRLGRPRSKK
jgi:TetR/AcrR family transcriptional regulator, tetracycline repressor protein